MSQEQYKNLLNETRNLGNINEMSEPEVNTDEGCKSKKKKESKVVMEQDDEGVDFIPGITAGEDLAMEMQETLDDWIDNMKEYHGEEKVADLLSNPDFISTAIENVETFMKSLGPIKPNKKSVAVDDEEIY